MNVNTDYQAFRTGMSKKQNNKLKIIHWPHPQTPKL